MVGWLVETITVHSSIIDIIDHDTPMDGGCLGGDSHNSRRSFAIPLEIITGFPFHLRLPVVVVNRIVMVVGGAMHNIEDNKQFSLGTGY